MQNTTSVLCEILTWRVSTEPNKLKVGLSKPTFPKFQTDKFELNDQGRALQILGLRYTSVEIRGYRRLLF